MQVHSGDGSGRAVEERAARGTGQQPACEGGARLRSASRHPARHHGRTYRRGAASRCVVAFGAAWLMRARTTGLPCQGAADHHSWQGRHHSPGASADCVCQGGGPGCRYSEGGYHGASSVSVSFIHHRYSSYKRVDARVVLGSHCHASAKARGAHHLASAAAGGAKAACALT